MATPKAQKAQKGPGRPRKQPTVPAQSVAPTRITRKAKGASHSYRDGTTPITSTSPTDSDDSDLSTPATSAIATPALRSDPISSTTTRKAPETADMSVFALADAAALRNGRLGIGSSKRKFAYDSDAQKEDHSRDAQLARRLQDEEDAAAQSATDYDEDEDEDEKPSTRKSSRNMAFIESDSEDDDEDEVDELDNGMSSRARGKRPQVILAKKNNSVSLPLPRKKRKLASANPEDGAALEVRGLDSDFYSDSDPDSDFDSEMDHRPMKTERYRRSHGVKQRKLGKLPAASTNTNDSDFVANDDEDDDIIDDQVGPDTRKQPMPRARAALVLHHPEVLTMWKDLEDMPQISVSKIEQPKNINRQLKPFQLEGVAWMQHMENTKWGGGLLGDEMGMGKTIQAVTLIMSDFPAKQPTLVLMPPVALMQWQQEIADYTDGTLKTFVFHGTNPKSKHITAKELKGFDVILMSYNSLESMYRHQEEGFKRKDGLHREESAVHKIAYHRVILDEAHSIKSKDSGTAKACCALKSKRKWCLSGTPMQNRIGEFFSLLRFLNVTPYAGYMCKSCKCSSLGWDMKNSYCTHCKHASSRHVNVFQQEIITPISKYGNVGDGKAARGKLRILVDRFMLRRVKRNHSSAMELPSKEIYVDRQFFGEEENDFATSIMTSGARKFETYVAQGVMLNNYANIFGLIMQMRQVANHPDLILKKNGQGGKNVLVCCLCDEVAQDAIRSNCKHDFCRECAKSYLSGSNSPDCPQCHIPLAIILEQPELEQEEEYVKKSSIINRIKMENWTSSSKIETLVHNLYEMRSKNSSSKSIIFSQFTSMLQLIEWRLRRAGITTVMLDGSMTPAQRQGSINAFMTDVKIECFLVSLRAGGVALNLTEASKVFIVDPWWNPAAEWQSADRCHRIGQARPCSITRLCIEDSVESRMVLLQEKKANMINSTIGGDESAIENLTPEDMQFLFRGN